MKLTTAVITSPGGRKINEDFADFLEIGNYGCYLLADGLGGHRGGDIASQTAVKIILEAFRSFPGGSPELLKSYIAEANSALKNLLLGAGHTTSSLKTTLVVFLTDELHARWAHVGDSRLYLFRDGKLKFQTKDHSVPQYLAASGIISEQQIRFHEDRNRLTAAFDGSSLEKVQYSVKPVLLNKKDIILLCSDGFWEYVLESDMENCLNQNDTPDAWLQALERVLIGRAESDHDNYTAIAIYVK